MLTLVSCWIFYFVFYLFCQIWDSLETVDSVFVSHCITDSPQGSDWAWSDYLNAFDSHLFSFLMPGRSLWKIQECARNVQLQKAKQLLTIAGHQSFQHVKESKIHQPLDHFNPQDLRTFPQVEDESELFTIALNDTRPVKILWPKTQQHHFSLLRAVVYLKNQAMLFL